MKKSGCVLQSSTSYSPRNTVVFSAQQELVGVALDDSERSVDRKFIEAHYIALFHLQSAHSLKCRCSERMQPRYLYCITAWQHIMQPRKQYSYIFCIPVFCRNKNNVPNKQTSFRYSGKLITSYRFSSCVQRSGTTKAWGGEYNGLRKSGAICGGSSTIGW